MKETIAKRLALKAADKKGFTLIEVIVVLVILAILAAIAIPALTGYIDKANQRALITEAASYRTALQAIGTDTIASGGTLNLNGYAGGSNLPDKYTPISKGTSGTTNGPTFNEELDAYLGNGNLESAKGAIIDITYGTKGQLTGFEYKGEERTVTYNIDSGYTIS